MTQGVPTLVVGVASSWLRTVRSGVPLWVSPFSDRALLERRSQSVCAFVLGGLPVTVLVLDQWRPARGSLSGIALLVVVAAGWALRTTLVVAVLVVAGLCELAYAQLGELDPAAASVREITLLLLAATSRIGILAWMRSRDARHAEIGLVPAPHRGDCSLDLDLGGVASEAVLAAAGTVLRPGLAGGRPAALLRIAERRVTLVSACDATGVALAGPGETPLGEADPALLRALSSGRTAVVTARQIPARLRELAAVARTGAWALARVTVAGEPFGVLAVAAPDSSEFGREDMRLLDGMARVAGLAIATAGRHARLAELKRRVQDGLDLALAVGRSLTSAEVVSSTLVRVVAGACADRATLARREDGRLVVESTYWAGTGGPVAIGREFPAEAVEAVPQLARALSSAEPLAAGQLDAGRAGRELAGALAGGRQTLLLPLPTTARTSWLLVLSRQGDLPFAPADLARLRPLADVALLALRNADRFAQVERARREASALAERQGLAIEAAERIGASPELDEVLEGVLRRAVDVAHAERGSISRADDDRMVVDCEHDRLGIAVGAGATWRLPDSALAAEAVRSGCPVRGGSHIAVPVAYAGWADRAGIEHSVACPLLVGRQLVGVLGLSRRLEPFRDEELLRLRPFATLAALLVRNARLLDDAREAGRAKGAFLHLAAHELRTPLSVLKGYLSMLEDGTFEVPDRTREEAVGILVRKAQELESLVESLLTTARLDIGRLPRTAAALDVGVAVRQALERAAPRARLEGARLEARLPDGELLARADGGHVARILDNLLNNALTYSPPPAEVQVAVRSGRAVEIVVRDRGLGIPAEQHDRVFERFHRLDGEITRFSPGLGLGLAISRELAQINDGSLLLERSCPGQGSTFVLRLPAARVGLDM